MTLSKAQAQNLWKDLQADLFSAEKNFKKILETKAWKQIGYDTLAEAWEAEMSHLLFGKELRVQVIAAMLKDGSSDEDIAMAVKGESINSVRTTRSKVDAGVDPAVISTDKPRAILKKSVHEIRVYFGPRQFQEVLKARGSHKRDWKKFETQAVLNAYRDL